MSNIKLSNQDRLDIIESLNKGESTMSKLARQYNVSRSTIVKVYDHRINAPITPAFKETVIQNFTDEQIERWEEVTGMFKNIEWVQTGGRKLFLSHK